MPLSLFNPEYLTVDGVPQRRLTDGTAALALPPVNPQAAEDDRVAAIVARVLQTMQPAQTTPVVPVVPSLPEYLERCILPTVQKKTERDCRIVAVRRLLSHVAFCGRCKISWRTDSAAGEQCKTCGDTRIYNPGIDLINSAALALLASSLIDDGDSPATAAKHVTYLMAVLNPAAEQGLIRKVKKPKCVQAETMIRILSAAEFVALYRAAELATWPRHSQFSPADFWRALLVFLLVYGLRLGEATSLPWLESAGSRKLARGIHAAPACPHAAMAHLNLESERGWLVYLPAKQSAAKPLPLVLPVRDVVADHLERIRGERRFVFDCYSELRSHAPGNYQDVKPSVYRQWNALLTAAGIPPERRATPHDIRRTQESLYDNDPQFGKGTGGEVNGHAARSVSDQYYSNALPRIHRAVLNVRLPELSLDSMD